MFLTHIIKNRVQVHTAHKTVTAKSLWTHSGVMYCTLILFSSCQSEIGASPWDTSPEVLVYHCTDIKLVPIPSMSYDQSDLTVIADLSLAQQNYSHGNLWSSTNWSKHFCVCVCLCVCRWAYAACLKLNHIDCTNLWSSLKVCLFLHGFLIIVLNVLNKNCHWWPIPSFLDGLKEGKNM